MAMNTSRYLAPVLLIALTGCDPLPPKPDDKAPAKAPAEPKAAGEAKTVEIGKNVFLEVKGDTRRVLVPAVVCFREGPLEALLCRKETKEHEAVVAADVDARLIHAALLAAGAKVGTPVQFEPKY